MRAAILIRLARVLWRIPPPRVRVLFASFWERVAEKRFVSGLWSSGLAE
jgi:hypothetical protein